MFGRVAAWSAAFLVVWPIACGLELSTFADANAPAAAVVVAAAQDRPQVQDQPQERDQIRTHDAGEAPAQMAALEPAEPQISMPAVPEPFALTTLPVASGDVLTKWTGVEADIRSEREILARCRESAERCPGPARNFLAIVAAGRAQTGRGRIGVINRAINLAIRPMSDLAQWGVPDRWSAPLETFTTGRGDCEDYAIAKYVALNEAGVAADDLKLVIVRNTAVGEDHAIAVARLDGAWIVLDNRWLTLVEDNEVPGMIPLFVLDQDGVRQFAPVIAPIASAAMPAAIAN
jgi:predicted transglutaminase-like cysteine proteinase